MSQATKNRRLLKQLSSSNVHNINPQQNTYFAIDGVKKSPQNSLSNIPKNTNLFVQVNEQDFIPFLNERDSLGRLIRKTPLSGTRSQQELNMLRPFTQKDGGRGGGGGGGGSASNAQRDKIQSGYDSNNKNNNTDEEFGKIVVTSSTAFFKSAARKANKQTLGTRSDYLYKPLDKSSSLHSMLGVHYSVLETKGQEGANDGKANRKGLHSRHSQNSQSKQQPVRPEDVQQLTSLMHSELLDEEYHINYRTKWQCINRLSETPNTVGSKRKVVVALHTQGSNNNNNYKSDQAEVSDDQQGGAHSSQRPATTGTQAFKAVDWGFYQKLEKKNVGPPVGCFNVNQQLVQKRSPHALICRDTHETPVQKSACTVDYYDQLEVYKKMHETNLGVPNFTHMQERFRQAPPSKEVAAKNEERLRLEINFLKEWELKHGQQTPYQLRLQQNQRNYLQDSHDLMNRWLKTLTFYGYSSSKRTKELRKLKNNTSGNLSNVNSQNTVAPNYQNDAVTTHHMQQSANADSQARTQDNLAAHPKGVKNSASKD